MKTSHDYGVAHGKGKAYPGRPHAFVVRVQGCSRHVAKCVTVCVQLPAWRLWLLGATPGLARLQNYRLASPPCVYTGAHARVSKQKDERVSWKYLPSMSQRRSRHVPDVS